MPVSTVLIFIFLFYLVDYDEIKLLNMSRITKLCHKNIRMTKVREDSDEKEVLYDFTCLISHANARNKRKSNDLTIKKEPRWDKIITW